MTPAEKERLGDLEKPETLEQLAARMYEVLKMVMQHGRIDDSESRMNMVANVITNAEKWIEQNDPRRIQTSPPHAWPDHLRDGPNHGR